MSFDAIKWAIAQKVEKSSAKFVLVAMADCVNAEAGADMVCWPSYKHLTERTCQDVKTVEAGLRRLRDSGFIVDTGERKGGTGQVIVYRLNTPKNGVLAPLPKITLEAPKTPVFGVALATNQQADLLTNTPNNGVVDTAGKTPVFPCKTPVFPVKDPQISHERPPKTGDGTSNGTSNGITKEPVKKARTRAADLVIPGVPDSLQADWTKVREKKRAGPITQTVIDGLLREATKAGISAAEAVTFCCEAGWQGFNAGWYLERQAKGQVKPTTGKHAGFQNLNYREGIAEDGTFN